MALRYKGRFPGVAVENAPQQLPNFLRMDIPGLVGFAERGPLDTPIMIEDIQQYRSVFGGDVFLAHDKGVPIYAQLPRAVQAFFDNGGRRCYVVRVAGNNARPNRFRIPGLVQYQANGDMSTVERPAAWVGSWSDGVNIATRLRRRPLRIYRQWSDKSFQYSPSTPDQLININLELPKATTVKIGDLLAIHLNDPVNTQIFTRVKSTSQLGYGSYESAAWQGIPVQVTSEKDFTTAFSTKFVLPPIDNVIDILYGYYREDKLTSKPKDPYDWYPLPIPRIADMDADVAEGDLFDFKFMIIDNETTRQHHPGCWCLCAPKNKKDIFVLPPVSSDADENVQVRDVTQDKVRFIYADDLIVDFHVYHVPEHPPNEMVVYSRTYSLASESLLSVEILGKDGWESLQWSDTSLQYIPLSRIQPFELRLRNVKRILGANDLLRLTFEGEHVLLMPVTSFDWEYLPNGLPELILASTQLLIHADPEVLTINDVDHVEFLAFDLNIREGNSLLENWVGRSFGPTEDIYWENILARVAQDKDVRTAKDIVDTGRSIRLGLVPDEETPNTNKPDTIPFFVPLHMLERQLQRNDFEGSLPDDRFARGTKDGLDSFDPIELFLDKDFHRSDHRQRLLPREIAEIANQKLYFPDPAMPRIQQKPKKLHSLYEIEDVSLIAIPDLAVRCWEQPHRVIPFMDKPEDCPGWEFYPCPEPETSVETPRELPFQREREEQAERIQQGDIQSTLYRQLAKLPVLVPFTDDCGCELDPLLVVQRALVNMCTARTDIVAILSLPQHFALHDVVDWHQQFVYPYDRDQWGDTILAQFICPRDALDEDALSYAVVYHGWTTVREELTPELNPLRLIVPDGTMLGSIAARTLERSVGIAPANQLLQGVVGLQPNITDAEWEILFDLQINVLRQRPGRFTVLSSHTLTQHRQLMKLSIRRLTIYIRKLVLQEGQRYVFETNTPRFRQAVQAMFDRVMNRQLQQGAIVGYRVDATDRINTPQDVEAGQFTIEIQYAPTYPVEYITIVLIRTSESLLEVVER